MKSLLFQDGAVFTEPPGCSAIPCRTEVPFTLKKGGRLYQYVLRDKIEVEDPYLVLVKAQAFAIRAGENNAGRSPERSVKDFLLKSDVVI